MALFSRQIKMDAEWIEGENGGIIIKGYLSDSYHEMKCEILFSYPDLRIISIKSEIIRYPHKECEDYHKNLIKLVGLKVKRDFYSKIMEKIGGPSGCAHINNLIYEMGMSAVQGRFAKQDELVPPEWENIPKSEKIAIYLKLFPNMKNTCIAWSEESPMVKEALKVKERI